MNSIQFLSQKHISESDYKHACNVYDSLNCKTFYDYHITYLRCDALLVADSFERLEKLAFKIVA